MTSNPVLVNVWRGGVVESIHRGAFAVLDAAGATVRRAGDIDRPIFPRSAVKALQALPLITSGAADALALSDEELALACASHSGEPAHTRTAAAMLAKAGVDESVLECGTHWPRGDETVQTMGREGVVPSALHNNCSGKHAGFVCLGCRLAGGAGLTGFLRGYIGPEHPVMREVTASLAATTGFDLRTAARGIDGCSIPTYAIPLRHLAQAFARLGTGIGLDADAAAAAARLRRAVAQAPFMVAGSGRFDTRVMARLGERVFCKVGAEGVYCAACPSSAWASRSRSTTAVARAAEAVLAALVVDLLPLDDADAAFVHGLADVTLRNWNGIEVGRLCATLPD